MQQKRINIEVMNGEGDFEHRTVILNAWGMRKALDRLPSIGRVLLQPMSMMAVGGSEGMSMDNLPLALAMLFDELDQTDTFDFISSLCEGAYCAQDKTPINVETYFGNDLSAMMQVAAENILLNYGCLYKGKGLRLLLTNLAGVSKAIPSA